MHDWREIVCRRLAEVGIDPVADDRLIQELAQHLEDRFSDSLSRGASDEDALAEALRELDQHERLAPELARNYRPVASPPPVVGPPLSSRIAALWQDVRYAARNLR